MNVSYRQLKAFLKAAQLLNFTRASEELHITQAGLSFMMRQLESQLNCRLFDRTTRLVSLTAAGEYFLPIARKIVDSMENAAEELAHLTAEARNKLVIGVTPLVSANVVPAACTALAIAYPQAKINVVATNHDQIQALVESGEIDFGLGAHFNAVPGVQLQPLFKYQLMWVTPGAVDGEAKGTGAGVGAAGAGGTGLAAGSAGSAGSAGAVGAGGASVGGSTAGTGVGAGMSTVPWTAVKDAVLYRLPSDNHIQQVIETHLHGIGRNDKEHHTFNNFELLIAMVSSGAGTAILPSYAVGACRRHGVQTAILTEPVVAMDFYQLTKRGRAPAELMGAFTDAFVASIPT